jgi:hypothetical protein
MPEQKKHTYEQLMQFTLPELRKMCEDRWNIINFGDKLDRAIADKLADQEARAFESRKVGLTAPKQTKLAREFFILYPQCILNQSNADVIDAALLALPRPTMTIQDLIGCYEKLCMAGNLEIDLSKCGISEKSEIVSGYALVNHSMLWKILEPVREETPESREAKLSAKEYRKIHPELEDTRISPIVQADWDRTLNYFLQNNIPKGYVCAPENAEKLLTWIRRNRLPVTISSLQAAFDTLVNSSDPNKRVVIDHPQGVAEASVVRETDFGAQRTPPQLPEMDYTKRRKIEKMSSNEFLQRVRSDPEFRRQIDGDEE